jgi:hypothetical protein
MRRRGRRILAGAVATLAAAAGVLVGATPAHADLTLDMVQCLANSTASVSGSAPSVVWGDTIGVTWTVNLALECASGGSPVIQVFADGLVQFSGEARGPGRHGTIGITPAQATSVTVIMLNGAGIRSLASTTVNVTPYDPAPLDPDMRPDITLPDNDPVWRRLFVRAVRTPGETVTIKGDLDLSGLDGTYVAPGVHIVGDPGVRPGGPRLYTRTFPDELLSIGNDAKGPSDHVLITGLRLDGGMSDDPFSAVGTPDADGIGVYSSQDVEIDHDELDHWRGSAVNVHDRRHLIGQANANTVRIHDNYIHHNQHPSAETCIDSLLGSGHAAGYGVQVSEGAYALIDRNVFDYNRHAIAGDGQDGTGYEAYDNLVLANGGVHFKCLQPSGDWVFVLPALIQLVEVTTDLLDDDLIYHTHMIDMHGSDPSGHGDHSGGRAGEWMDVQYNTVLYTAGNAVHLRGTPMKATDSPDGAHVGMDVKHNVFAHQDEWAGIVSGILSPGALLQNETGLSASDNIYGLNTFNNRKSCDFDGDGRADGFIATGVAWWYQSSRLANRWVFLNRSPALVGAVTLADSNGDGMCDVTSGGNVYPTTTNSLSLTQQAGTAAPGGSVTTRVNFAPVIGPQGPLTLTATGLPTGVTASFSPPTVSAGSPTSTLTLTNTAGAGGNYPIAIHAGVSVEPVTYLLSLPDFSLSLDPAAGGVTQGGSITTKVHLRAVNGFTGSVNLSAGLPSGMSASFSPATVSSANPDSTMTVTTTSTTLNGLQEVVVSGTPASGGTNRTTNYELTVGSGYTIFVSLQSGSVGPGGSAITEVTLNPTSGTAQSVVPSVTHVPAGVIVAFSQSTLTSSDPTATATITATAAATPGTYTLFIGAGLYAYSYQLTIGGGDPSS